MAHGGFPRRRVEGRQPLGRRTKGSGVDKNKKKDNKSLRNQIRSTERFLRMELPLEVRASQQQKLEELKKQQDSKAQLAIEHKLHSRAKRIKFFERRKAERMIRRLEKQLRLLSENESKEMVSAQLAKYREDLEYIRFFPKSQKYVSLYFGGDNPRIVDKRNRLRKQIKDNLTAAAAIGKDLEETGSDDDVLDLNDDFFSAGCSSDEAEADDEWTDKSTRESGSCASGKAASSMSSDERNKRHVSEKILTRPARPFPSSRFHPEVKAIRSTFSNGSRDRSGFSSRSQRLSNGDHTSNLSSNSEVYKPRRKRRPKKKKQASSA